MNASARLHQNTVHMADSRSVGSCDMAVEHEHVEHQQHDRAGAERDPEPGRHYEDWGRGSRLWRQESDDSTTINSSAHESRPISWPAIA